MRRMTWTKSWIICLGLSHVACNEPEKNENRPIQKPFLVTADLVQQNSRPLSQEDVQQEIGTFSTWMQVPRQYFMSDFGPQEPTPQGSGFDYCWQKKMRSSLSILIDGDELRVFGRANFSDCFKEKDVIGTANIHQWQGEIEIYREYSCEDADWAGGAGETGRGNVMASTG